LELLLNQAAKVVQEVSFVRGKDSQGNPGEVQQTLGQRVPPS